MCYGEQLTPFVFRNGGYGYIFLSVLCDLSPSVCGT